MKLLLITVTLLAGTWAQSLSSEYLPPTEDYSVGASNFVETNFLDNEPAHSLADDGYRYRAVKRFRLRHRRDVSELANTYLPPHATSASAPASAYNAFESVPAPVVDDSYEVEASAPAHTLADDGYRYRTVKRYRLRRRRRDVSEVSNTYLPPHATAASAPAPAYNTFESVPAPVVDDSYEVEASAPAHTLADDGYRYRTVKRYRLRRRRRDVSELANTYLPPQATAASVAAPVVDDSYEVEASAPAHTLTDDGYRYRTVKRYRVRRRRRDVNELANNYLPPQATAASAPAPAYSTFESAPAPVIDDSYEVEASAPAHTLADDGYRYRTVKRYRLRRRRRDVSELANTYLPPQATAASVAAPVVDDSYEVEASAPAHTLADDGYRYRTVKRYRLRHRH